MTPAEPAIGELSDLVDGDPGDDERPAWAVPREGDPPPAEPSWLPPAEPDADTDDRPGWAIGDGTAPDPPPRDPPPPPPVDDPPEDQDEASDRPGWAIGDGTAAPPPDEQQDTIVEEAPPPPVDDPPEDQDEASDRPGWAIGDGTAAPPPGGVNETAEKRPPWAPPGDAPAAESSTIADTDEPGLASLEEGWDTSPRTAPVWPPADDGPFADGPDDPLDEDTPAPGDDVLLGEVPDADEASLALQQIRNDTASGPSWPPAPAEPFADDPDTDEPGLASLEEGWDTSPRTAPVWPPADDGPFADGPDDPLDEDTPAPSDEPATPDAGGRRRRFRRGPKQVTPPDKSQFAQPPKQKRSRTKREASPRRVRGQPTPESIRKASVTIIDGRVLVHVTIRRGKVTSVTRDDSHPDVESAARAASRRRGVLVWACADVRAVPRPPEAGSARAQRLVDAGNAQAAFGPDVQVVRCGQLLLGVGGEAIAAAAGKASLRFAAAAAAPADGHWVRIGVSGVDVTMVKDGVVYEHAHIPNIGTASVRAALDAGGDPVQVRAEHVERLAVAVSAQRREWMGSVSTEALMHLHGPGAGWAGVDTVLLEVSGCRVLTPRVIDAAEGVARADLGHAAVAALGYLSPEAFSTQRVLAGELRKATFKKWVPALVAMLLAGAMFAWSWRQGQQVSDRIAAAEYRTSTAWELEDIEGKALSEQALAVTELLDTLTTEDGYAWRNVVEFRSEQARLNSGDQHYSVEVSRCESLEVSETVGGGFAGVDAAEPMMQARAEEMFGTGATAVRESSSESFRFEADDSIDVAYRLVPPASACGAGE